MTPRAQERSAAAIMERFARRTGLAPDGPQRRYLWTDAHAVVNYLSLLGRTGDAAFRELALLLIDRVHHVLGRYRTDDERHGWISGLEEGEGERHPTIGGLRIGKPLPERAPGEPFDRRLEWERDGQYYHYLLRWMHALDRAAALLGEPELHGWAAELAVAAQRAFTHEAYTGARPRMFWKMSTDLSRPLVPAQGAHDPLDGFVTACLVSAHTAAGADATDLRDSIGTLATMCDAEDWVTSDPLGVGGLLCDAWWAWQLVRAGAPEREMVLQVLPAMVNAASMSLRDVARTVDFGRHPSERLAFRELGLVIGLHGAAALVDTASGLSGPLASAIEDLGRHFALAEQITSTWLEPASQATATWRAHQDINDVMLTTALLPDEHLRA